MRRHDVVREALEPVLSLFFGRVELHEQEYVLLAAAAEQIDMPRRRRHTLQTTALVHEAYVRLVGLDRMTIHNRTHFFAMAARLMREILVDHARRKNAQKRGGGVTMVSVDEGAAGAESEVVDVLALDQALTDLAALEDRLCRVVELRFFAGLSIAEAADALDVSSATVERDWTVAKAWLLQRLSPPSR